MRWHQHAPAEFGPLLPAPATQGPPAGCARFTVELRKPMGFVLEQRAGAAGIFVAAVTPDGAAARAGVGVVRGEGKGRGAGCCHVVRPPAACGCMQRGCERARAERAPDCQPPAPSAHAQGDQLISTTGVTYNRTDDYLGVTVRKGQQVVTLSCASESLKTVSAAIGSHPAGMPVRLTLQKCEAPPAAGSGGGGEQQAAAGGAVAGQAVKASAS